MPELMNDPVLLALGKLMLWGIGWWLFAMGILILADWLAKLIKAFFTSL